LGIGDEARRTALDILRQRYVDEIVHAEKFTQHAGQMHYPQFREKLLHIAAQETEHSGLLAKKIIDLGGKLPEVTGERASTGQCSWQHLQKDLAEEDHCAGEFMEQIWAVATDYPDIAVLLEQIRKEERNIVTKSARCSCGAMHSRDRSPKERINPSVSRFNP
jgi:bacterioferritin (cytochrome b1)